MRFGLLETVAEDGIQYLGRWGDGRGGRDSGSRGREQRAGFRISEMVAEDETLDLGDGGGG